MSRGFWLHPFVVGAIIRQISRPSDNLNGKFVDKFRVPCCGHSDRGHNPQDRDGFFKTQNEMIQLLEAQWPCLNPVSQKRGGGFCAAYPNCP
jgi:hypothetical protein